jgi:hypothetical protein
VPLTNAQKGLLHSVPQSLGVDDEQRKLVQVNIGGAWSAVDMTYAGFVRVMAFWEQHGWTDGRNGRGYWAAQEKGVGLDALRGKCWRLAALAGWTVPGRPEGRNLDYGRLDRFVASQFAHTSRADTIMACLRGELLQLIEALKSIAVQAGADVKDYYGPARPRGAASGELRVVSCEGRGKPLSVPPAPLGTQNSELTTPLREGAVA